MKSLIFIAGWLLTAQAYTGERPEDSFLTGREGAGFVTEPGIAIEQAAGQVKITFLGQLQSADNVSGPWTDLVDALSPYYPAPGGNYRFYRTRDPDSIFAATSVVALSLTGPFQTHFDLAFAGLPDGIFPPKREKPYFPGDLKMAGFQVEVSVRVRGNSSLQECPFPKLKFKVSKENRPGTPFFDAREVKIGTHCAEGGRGTIGRLRDQTAAFREALAYETMSLAGFISPRVRRARIEYLDTSGTNQNATTGWPVTRDAVILDDIEVVAARMGGRALDDEEIAALTNADFDPQLVTDLQFLHALLGNWDYLLSVDGRSLWNTEVIEKADGQLMPVAGDFDLSSWVTGTVRVTAPPGYRPDLPEIERRAHYELEQIAGRVSAASFEAARARFIPGRGAMELQIQAAQIDDAGRTNALEHVAAFYHALESVRRGARTPSSNATRIW